MYSFGIVGQGGTITICGCGRTIQKGERACPAGHIFVSGTGYLKQEAK